MDKPRLLLCRYPFPHQDPPIEMPEPCSAKCPNYDAEVLARHSEISPDDPELLAALGSFAKWFYVEGQQVDGQIHYAAELYTRSDHSGTCIPKTMLFAHYKSLQFAPYTPLEVSENSRKAVRGEEVASWPDGELAQGTTTWNQMFAMYSRRYD